MVFVEFAPHLCDMLFIMGEIRPLQIQKFTYGLILTTEIDVV